MVSYTKEFENVILSDYSEESLNSFVPGSDSQLYVTVLKQIKNLQNDSTIPEKVNFNF